MNRGRGRLFICIVFVARCSGLGFPAVGPSSDRINHHHASMERGVLCTAMVHLVVGSIALDSSVSIH
eukprot:scaffold668321_cov88-Prasinocladus_malaysianus.AAC.1